VKYCWELNNTYYLGKFIGQHFCQRREPQHDKEWLLGTVCVGGFPAGINKIQERGSTGNFCKKTKLGFHH
jgi:hypothetical protein